MNKLIKSNNDEDTISFPIVFPATFMGSNVFHNNAEGDKQFSQQGDKQFTQETQPKNINAEGQKVIIEE